MTKYVSLVDGSEYEMPSDATVTGWPGPPMPRTRRDEEITGPENTYLLFKWDDYNALGGVGDFVAAFNTIGEAQDGFERDMRDNAEIAVLRDGKFVIVAEFGKWWDEAQKRWYSGWRRPR